MNQEIGYFRSILVCETSKQPVQYVQYRGKVVRTQATRHLPASVIRVCASPDSVFQQSLHLLLRVETALIMAHFSITHPGVPCTTQCMSLRNRGFNASQVFVLILGNFHYYEHRHLCFTSSMLNDVKLHHFKHELGKDMYFTAKATLTLD